MIHKVEIKKIPKGEIRIMKHIGTAVIQSREAALVYVVPIGVGIQFKDSGDTYFVDAMSIGEVLHKELKEGE